MKKTSLTLLALALSISSLQAQTLTERCEALGDSVFPGGHITSTRMINAQADLPEYCEVRVTALPAISIEVRLPTQNWNGKYYQAGCGGFCGVLGRADASNSWINAMRPGLQRGYATATSDSGHHALAVTDGAWAFNNPHAERDWGYRSISETHRVAQLLITEFYKQSSDQAIFQGCSTGGRMAHVAAQRFPDLFDGIISGAPAMDYPGLVGTKLSFLIQANTDDQGKQIIGPAEAALIGETVLSQCDTTDGKADGVIEDPRLCRIDYSALDLTQPQLNTLQKWREGPRNSLGEQLYPGGVPEGSEMFWWLWLTGNDKGSSPLVPAFANDFGRYMAFDNDPGPGWTALDFDHERDPERMQQATALYNGDNPDLSAFRQAGGKMIVFHGWADAIVTPYKTLEWYEQASDAAGGEEVLKENVALFMIPGLDHCGILPGPGGVNAASLDPMTPLEAWLNEGIQPQSIRVSE